MSVVWKKFCQQKCVYKPAAKDTRLLLCSATREMQSNSFGEHSVRIISIPDKHLFILNEQLSIENEAIR